MEQTALTFRKGLKDGMPICLGYLSVSFAFGIMATQGGLPVWVALLISMTNLTSAGQVAGTQLILAGGTYVEIAVTTFIINIPLHVDVAVPFAKGGVADDESGALGVGLWDYG